MAYVEDCTVELELPSQPHAVFDVIQQSETFLQEHGMPDEARCRATTMLFDVLKGVALGGHGRPSAHHILLRLEHLSDGVFRVSIETSDAHGDSRQLHVCIAGNGLQTPREKEA